MSSGPTIKSAGTSKSNTDRRMALNRIAKIAEYWFENANDEFGFGVIHGLRLAQEALNGKDESEEEACD